jgi:hypothetical protein
MRACRSVSRAQIAGRRSRSIQQCFPPSAARCVATTLLAIGRLPPSVRKPQSPKHSALPNLSRNWVARFGHGVAEIERAVGLVDALSSLEVDWVDVVRWIAVRAAERNWSAIGQRNLEGLVSQPGTLVSTNTMSLMPRTMTGGCLLHECVRAACDCDRVRCDPRANEGEPCAVRSAPQEPRHRRACESKLGSQLHRVPWVPPFLDGPPVLGALLRRQSCASRCTSAA